MFQNDTTALHFVVTCLSMIIIMIIIPYVTCITSYVIIIIVHIIIQISHLTLITQCTLNDACQSGTTALHYAAKEGHQDVVKLLLEKGYDINAKSNVRWQ
jgi:Ankyrin repeats (3 copies)